MSEVAGLRAIAHPTRLQMLSLLTGTAMSAAEIARELGISHANASYHLRTLAAAGEVVEAGEERIRGGVAKRYRHPWDTRAPIASTADHQAYVRVLAAELVRRDAQRKRGTPGVSADADLWVDPQVWQQVFAQVKQAAMLLHREAVAPRTAGTVRVAMTAALFELEQDPA